MKNLFIIMLLVLSIGFVYAEKTVVATGYGITKAQAKKDALRNAVEQGAGVKIFSSTQVKDFVALKDVMVSESFGLVTSYQEISAIHKEAEEIWEVKVRATISRDVGKKWAKIKIILEQKGRPSIMFCLKELVDGKINPDKIGEYNLVQKFKNLGFEVIDREDSQITRNLEKHIEELDQLHNINNKAMQNAIAIASQRGADLLVVGFLESNFVKIQNVYDLRKIIHRFNYRCKVIRTDTSQIVASLQKTYPGVVDGFTETRKSASKKGFSKVITEPFIGKLLEDMIKHWIRDVQEGTHSKLVITNVKFRMRKKILRVLKKYPDLIPWIKVEHYRNKRLQLKIKTKLTMDELAEKLEELPGEPFEVSELKKNTLILQYIK